MCSTYSTGDKHQTWNTMNLGRETFLGSLLHGGTLLSTPEPHSPAQPHALSKPQKETRSSGNRKGSLPPFLGDQQDGSHQRGIRRRPGSVRFWIHWNGTGYAAPPLSCGSYLLRWCAALSIRHERSHIMYWKCGRNRLMSFVKREKVVLIPAVHPTVRGPRSISVTFAVWGSQNRIGSRVKGPAPFGAEIY